MKHLNTQNGAILFTDLKSFTLKSSLLTELQIRTLLNRLDEICLPIIEKNNGKIVKSIGDSYMVFFDNALNSIEAAIAIQKKLNTYNKDIRFNLYKIELRISIDYGKIEKEETISGEDYFGETVNISSRLNNLTPANEIYITDELKEAIISPSKFTFYSLGDVNFKGILHKSDIYNVIYRIKDKNSIKKGEYKIDIIDNTKTKEDSSRIKEIDESIFKYSSVAAILGIQPVPFMDTYSVVPIHMLMLREIAKDYGINLSLEEAKGILTTLLSSIGSNYAISQGIVGVSKIGLIGIGGYVMIPLNFALTFAMGKILSYYFYSRTQGLNASNSELKELFNYSVKSGKNMAKKEKDIIIQTGKKYSKNVTEKITDINLKDKIVDPNITEKITDSKITDKIIDLNYKSKSGIKKIISKIKKH